MCGCNNGRLTCTDIDGCRDKNDEQDEDERKCERCQDASMSLVCGRDGRTYNSRCIAMNCSGLGENDILDGPCSNQVYRVLIILLKTEKSVIRVSAHGCKLLLVKH